MCAIPLPRRGGLPARAKYALCALIGAMLAYVLYRSESFLIDPARPVWAHYAGIKWTLLPHGIAGAMIAETVIWCCIAFAYPLADLASLIDEWLRAREIARAPTATVGNAAE